jgi:hypothetical protein
MDENMIPKKAIIGRVAVLGIENKAVAQEKRKIAMTSNTTNIKM